MNVEWDIPFLLTSPYGDLPFNDYANPEPVSGVTLKLDPSKCSTSAGLRLTRDNLSQRDGSIVHREFTEGYTIHLSGWAMLDDDTPACGADLRAFYQELQRAMHALLGNDVVLDGDNARLAWSPAGYGQNRLLTELRVLEEVTVQIEEAIAEVSFALHSPHGYAIDALQQMENITDIGSSVVITNGGNTPTYPAILINGLVVGSAEIANAANGKTFVYDTGLPGAQIIGLGDYAFISTFGESVYLNGSGANLKAGVDVEASDFWPLEPGDNLISLPSGDSGLSVDIIWNDAWY